MKRILCIVSSMNAGGAETFLMKIYRAMDKTKYQMDFCVSSKDKGFYDEEIKSYGGKIFYAPPKTKNPLNSFLVIKKIVKDNKYKYVMRISQHAFGVLDLIAAKLGGAKKLVLRSSNSSTDSGRLSEFLHKAFKFLPMLVPNVKIAPSSIAGEFVFGKSAVKKNKVLLLNNAVCVKDFVFSAETRNKKRAELGLDKEFVIGHIGRLVYQKNHKFLIKVFSEIVKCYPEAILLLVGDGELKSDIETLAVKLNVLDNICFLGIRSDIPELLMAMDVMVFPSFYEGMPNTIIEAQASGLRCVISDTITREANITGLVDYVSLDDSEINWANKILEYNNNYARTDQTDSFTEAGYNIEKVARIFEKTIFE